jgi:hypothetical protein
MAESTPFVLAAGGMVFADRALNRGTLDAPVAAATFAAALATAAIDKAVPGLGKGLAMIMVVAAGLTSGVAVVKWIDAQTSTSSTATTKPTPGTSGRSGLGKSGSSGGGSGGGGGGSW